MCWHFILFWVSGKPAIRCKGWFWTLGLIPLMMGCVTESGPQLPTAIAAEYAPVDLRTAAHPCAEILRQLRPRPYHVRIDPAAPNWVTCPGGTHLFIPQHVFADQQGSFLHSQVDLYISEATNNWETIAFDVAQGMGPGRIPSTLGTIRLQAFAGEEELDLRKERPILALFPTMPRDWAYQHHGASLPPLLPFYWDYEAPQFARAWTEDLLPDAQLTAPYPEFPDYGLADPVTLDFEDKEHVVNKVLGKAIAESATCPEIQSLLEREHKVGFRVDDGGAVTTVHVTGVNADCYLKVVEPAMKMIRWDLSKAGTRREWSFTLWEAPLDLPVTSEVSDEAVIHMNTLNPLYRGKLRQALTKLADSTLVSRMATEGLVLQNLGWTTVDTGYPINGNGPVVVDLGDSLKAADAKVWFMLPKMHAVVELPRDSSGMFSLDEWPADVPGKFVALAYHNDLGAMFCAQQWSPSDPHRISLHLSPIQVKHLPSILQRQ